MTRKQQFRSGALQALHDRFIGDDPERVASFERALSEANVAQDIYNLRTEAGLTQRELAELVGTTASVISRLEDADYEGHSLSMLRRVAAALGRRVEVHFPVAKTSAEGESIGAPLVGTLGGPAGAPIGGTVGAPIGGAIDRPAEAKADSKDQSKDPAEA
jgi:transcriptional regulator with XRE-family HTH domain